MLALKLLAVMLVAVFLLQIRVVSSMSGHFFHMEHKCLYSGDDLKLVETYQQCFYDKVLVMRFNRSISTFIGYTHWTTELADKWQKDGGKQIEMDQSVDGVCGNALALYKQLKNYMVQPKVRLHQIAPPNSRHPAILQCSVYGFYPKQIQVTWMKNGQELTTGVTSTEVLSNGNWRYQAHSRLVLSSQDAGERISCVVQHPSFRLPERHYWDKFMSTSKTSKNAVGATVLLLGVILCIAGMIYYQRKVSGLGYCNCNTSRE